MTDAPSSNSTAADGAGSADAVGGRMPENPATGDLSTSAGRYRAIRLIRRFEQQALDLVKSGVIVGGTHPYIGQEAVAVGVCAALRPQDQITSTHRGHGHVLAKGADPARMLAELAGRVDGLNHGRGGSMHAADLSLGVLGANGIVGAGAPIAAGAAWAAKREGTDRVVVTFFGDGALNQGVLLETWNLAAIWSLPVVFVCENNGYATTLPAASAVSDPAGTGSGVARAAGFGLPAEAVDGMDAEAVLAAATRAVGRARGGGGPSYLECATYRFEGHHTMERRMRLSYRSAEEITSWRERDPLERAGALLTEGEREAIDADVEQTLAAALEFALASPQPDPASAADYLYAGGLTPRPGVTV